MSNNNEEERFSSSISTRGNYHPTSNWKGVILILTSATGFSTLAIWGKIAYASGLNLPSILAFRFLGSAILLGSWLLIKRRWKTTFGQAAKALLLGAIGYSIQATLFFSALLYTGAGVATLLFYTYPAFVTLLAWIVEGETPDKYRRVALGVALIGCAFTSDFSQATVDPMGVMFGIASGVWYSIYLTFGARLVKSVDPIESGAYVSLGAAFSFILAALATNQITIPNSLDGLGALVGIAILATTVPIVTLFSGIQKIGITRTAIVSTVEPVITVFLGILFLGEQLEGIQLWGGLMVIVSVVLSNLGKRDLLDYWSLDKICCKDIQK